MNDPATTARNYLDAWTRHDLNSMFGLMHGDYTIMGGDGQVLDAAAGRAQAQAFANAFPDGRLDIQRLYAAGNVVVVEFNVRGTHTGDLMGIPPTGHTVDLPVCDVIEVRDGKIFAEREYMDMSVLMKQLGVAGPEA